MTNDLHAELERRACRGEAAAFGQLARMYDSDLRNVVWSVFRQPRFIDDIMQSSYERAFAKIATFDSRSSLKTWLAAICYRTAVDHARYEGRRRHSSVDDEEIAVGYDATFADSIDVAAHVASRDALERAMARLSSDEAAILTMTAGLGYSFDEVATVMNIKRGTVASRASRARSRLQQELRS